MKTVSLRFVELLSSMRFAISLLTLIAIASIIGTVLKQNEPYASYLNQFGPFWFRAFELAGLYAVYNAPWFIGIMAFLVVSTSVCISRNAGGMIRQMTTFREGVRESSLRAMGHSAALSTALPSAEALGKAADYLRGQGYVMRRSPDGGTLAAKAGSANRIGYLLTHSAIVAICVGGLLDSNVPLQLKLALGDKKPVDGSVLMGQVPPSARLSADNLSFRGNTLIPEGSSSEVTLISIGEGMLVQELPFKLSLKKFHIEHYSTGQPKLFASDVIVTDRDSGKSFEARIEVNKPLIYRGIAAYQASFDDGGTRLAIEGHHLLAPQSKMLQFDSRIGDASELKYGGETYRIEFAGFRPINVENLSMASEPTGPRETRGVMRRLEDQMGSASDAIAKKDLRNVGASFSYKLRDAAGQAREYHNYMLPVLLEDRWVILSGMRENPNESFRYLRLPMDENLELDEFLRLRAGMLDVALRAAIARNFAKGAVSGDAASQTMRERLAESAERTLDTFSRRGYQAVADFLERAVPEGEREQAAEIYLRVLQGAAWEAWQAVRKRDGLPALEQTAERLRFVQDGLNALSDSFFYGVPVYLQLKEFDEVKASVFQMTRSPGRNTVYVGCALLILGVFAMLYIRERRAWLMVRDGSSQQGGINGGFAVFAMQCNRSTLDFDHEFERHKAALQALLGDGNSTGNHPAPEARNGTGTNPPAAAV